MRIDWSALAARVADRADVDWCVLEQSTSSGGERRALRALRDVSREEVRGPTVHTISAPATATGALAAWLGVLALFKVAGALLWGASIGSLPDAAVSPFFLWQRATMIVFATAGIVLRLAAGTNAPVAALGAAYLGISAAFVGSVVGQVGPAASRWDLAAVELLRWPADLALPAGLWAFVACFPPLEPAARLQRLTLWASTAAAAVIAYVFTVNVTVPHLSSYFPPMDRVLTAVSRKDLQSQYTLVFFVLIAAAVPLAFARLGYGYVQARREVRRLLVALAAGFAPVAVLSTIGASSHAGAAFLTRPAVLPAATFAVFAGLWSLPLSTGAALLAGDRILRLQPVLRASVRYATSRWVLNAAIAVPLAVCVYLAMRNRSATIDAFLAAGGSTWLAVSAASLALASFRTQIRQSIDRVFSRRTTDIRSLVTTLAGAARRQPSAQGIAELLIDAIRRVCSAKATAIIAREPLSAVLSPIAGESPSMSMDSAIATLLAGSGQALNLRDRSSANIATLLPESELALFSRWSVLIPLHAEGDEFVGVACVADPSATDSYSTDDLDSLRVLCAAVGQVFGQRLGAGGDIAPAARAAQECVGCGELTDVLGLTCHCGGALVGSSLPRQLGRFTVLRRIGRGGMGVVYKAKDEALNRTVALKALPQVSLEERMRLGQEAQVMASLQHPAIASVFGLEMFRAMPVLVIEYFTGGTLQDRLREHALSPLDVVAIGVQLAGALEHVHAAGVLHRDLKPSNIGLTTSGQPKVFDFGIATLAGVDDATAAGTFLYLAPESIRGDGFSVASDVWALGVVFCEAWIGRHPAADLSRREQIALIRSGRLWEHARRTCPPEPIQFHTALASALNPDAAFRCPSASEFARIIAPSRA